jgi:YfiH family protein
MLQPHEEGAEEPAFVLREREVDTSTGKVPISYVACKPLEDAGFTNAFSTRLGGVSAFPSDALNLGFFKGDKDDNVAENRRRFLQAIGAAGSTIVSARQTHSTTRCSIDTMSQARGPAGECDALTSRLGGLLLAIQTADCLPVLIADPKSCAMAAVHAGWRGTAGRITERTVADLMQKFGATPRDCLAALGPSACAACYEVGDDVIERYKKEFGYWRKLLTGFKEGGKAHLDVRAANVQQLVFCGFPEDCIHVAPYCTMHQNDVFFSYRRESRGGSAPVGRLLSVIGRIG